MRLKLSFNIKIALLVLTFTTLGMMGIAYLGFFSADRLIQQQSQANIIDSLDRATTDLLAEFNSVGRNALRLANSHSTLNLINQQEQQQPETNYQQFIELATALLDFYPAYIEVGLLDQDNRELLHLEKISPGDIIQIPVAKLQQSTFSPYLQQTQKLAAGEYLFSNIELKKDAGRFTNPVIPIVRVMVPIYGKQHAFSGIITLVADFRQLTKQLNKPPSNTRYFLSNNQGDYLFHPEEKNRFQLDFGTGKGLSSDFTTVDFSRKPLDKSVGRQIARQQTPPPTFTTAQLTNRKEILVFRHININPTIPDSTFIIGAILSQHLVTEKSWQYWNDIIGIALLSAVGLSIIIAFASQVLTAPINKLTNIANRIAAGEQNITPKVESNDEIGELAQAFIDMINRLNHSNTALQELARSLEEQVIQRTADLAVARDQALASSCTKSTFLTTMSHEIRTPLNVVLGILELLKDEVDPKQREHVNLAYGAGRNLLVLINNVLDFSKIDANQFSLDNVDFDLAELIEDTTFSMAPLAHNKKIELTALFPLGVATAVQGDPNRLRQIFTNLLGNAIKFTPEGGSVELHGGPVAKINGSTEYLFEIRDSGVGIAIADRERIFESFTQTATSSTQRPEGTGLGLTICKHLVELMGGKIAVDANPSHPSGSIFYFYLTLQQQLNHSAERENYEFLQGMKILGVDSAGLATMQLANILESAGAHYDSVAKIAQAKSLLEQAVLSPEPYRIVIINQKPGKDRRSDFQHFQYYGENIGFIILTDLLDQSWDEAMELPSTTICIRKPVTRSRLFSAIRWIVGGKNMVAGKSSYAISFAKQLLAYDYDILLVDDQKPNQNVARSMLTRLGCNKERIALADNGQEAVNLCKTIKFAMIFMDCQMPVLDGMDATKEIRRLEKINKQPPTPIIAFTADVSPKTRETIVESGMDDVISKPVALANFQKQLETYLAGNGAARNSAKQPSPTDRRWSDQHPANPITVNMADILRTVKYIGLEEDEFKEVAVMLAEQLPELINGIKRDMHGEDIESALATSHVLKGSMANTIFPQLQAATKELHQTIKSNRLNHVDYALKEVEVYLQPVQTALQEYIDSDTTPDKLLPA